MSGYNDDDVIYWLALGGVCIMLAFIILFNVMK